MLEMTAADDVSMDAETERERCSRKAARRQGRWALSIAGVCEQDEAGCLGIYSAALQLCAMLPR
jgi:hypothetical protein